MQPLERTFLLGDLLLETVRRRPDRLVEEREQQLVLPGEVLVEAAQRLPGAVHDLLDGELLAGLGVAEEFEPGIEEALHPALAPDPSRVERAGHRQVPATQRRVGGGRRGWRLEQASAQCRWVSPFENFPLSWESQHLVRISALRFHHAA